MAELSAVASILQIADAGVRLGLRLYTFGQTVANADKAIIAISKDVSLTSSVVQQLGEQLQADREAPIYSQNGIETAQGIVDECHTIFNELDRVLEKIRIKRGIGGKEKAKWVSAVKERFKWPFLQPKMESLRSNLDRLRVNLLLILNVIIYARQRLEQTLPSQQLESQRRLIEDLARLNAPTLEASSPSRNITEPAEPSRAIPPPQQSGPILDTWSNRITQYCSLINKLLEQIDNIEYQIDPEVRSRIRSDVVSTHKRETASLGVLYGYKSLRRTMTGNAGDLVAEDIEAKIPAIRAALTQHTSTYVSNSMEGPAMTSSRVLRRRRSNLSSILRRLQSTMMAVFEEDEGSYAIPCSIDDRVAPPKHTSIVDELVAHWTTL